MQLHKKYYILIGHYGSGKTELSIALARHCKKNSQNSVALVDLDIVNPYFRSSEHQNELQEEGIHVITPSFAHTTVDVPALRADVQAVFESTQYTHVVFDVGGDPSGATALGRYATLIKPIRDQMQVLFVVNPYRPLTANEEDICMLLERIQARARLQADILVNNANLQRQTTAQHIIDSQSLLMRVSERLSIPVGMISGYSHLYQKLPKDMQKLYFPIQPLMLPDWLEDDNI